MQLIASAGAVLLQREIPEPVNLQVAQVSDDPALDAALQRLLLLLDSDPTQTKPCALASSKSTEH